MSRTAISFLMLWGIIAPSWAQTDQVKNNPIYQQGVKLVDAQTACWMKEVRSQSVAKVDLQTAAYSVVARCADETLRYKEWHLQNTNRTPSQFADYWNQREQGDLEQIKKMIAIIRTQ